ncbi:hypothetical protein DH2020_003124 [Rehmannia glutinosa]|uniref:Uncharacterized protein n=1 Tax=Rehmannia glutinosa TaxID=99300 RepID=A0ABR0XKV7_REHGL
MSVCGSKVDPPTWVPPKWVAWTKPWEQQAEKSSFSLFGLFKSRNSSRPAGRRGDDYRDEYVKAYKVYPSDEDRGRWVAEPGIDKKASAYISLTTNKWEKLAVAN